MSLSLRPAAPADVPRLLGFIRALATYERLLDQVEADEVRLRATLFPTEGRPAAECVLACWDGQPAGFALFFPTYSTFLARPGLHLEDLFVVPEHRGRGLGRALLRHVAHLARERGCGRLEWSVLDWNQPAIAFYEALGARRLPEWQLCRLTAAELARLP